MNVFGWDTFRLGKLTNNYISQYHYSKVYETLSKVYQPEFK